MLVGTHVLRGGDAARGAAKSRSRADCPEGDVLGTEAQIVVFELGRPVIEEGILETETDQQTIQRGASLRGSATYAAVYIRRAPVKSAGHPSRFAVNERPVKGDTKPRGNVVIPFVAYAGAFKQGVAIDPTKPIDVNLHPRPEAFTLNAENEHAGLV